MSRIVACLLGAILGGTLWAQAPDSKPPDPKTPTLTAEQRTTLLLAAKDVEIWQLRLQQAATELDKARTAVQQIVTTITPPGYVLNEKLELVKAPPPPPPPDPKKE